MLHVLKIKGTKSIPDFVQIRDEKMILRAYFRLSQIESGLQKNGFENDIEGIKTMLNEIPFGKIHKYIRKYE